MFQGRILRQLRKDPRNTRDLGLKFIDCFARWLHRSRWSSLNTPTFTQGYERANSKADRAACLVGVPEGFPSAVFRAVCDSVVALRCHVECQKAWYHIYDSSHEERDGGGGSFVGEEEHCNKHEHKYHKAVCVLMLDELHWCLFYAWRTSDIL